MMEGSKGIVLLRALQGDCGALVFQRRSFCSLPLSLSVRLSLLLCKCNSSISPLLRSFPTYLKGGQSYDGINGEYRQLADSNVYYKRTNTGARTAIWWLRNHTRSGGMWIVGPSDAVGTASAWAFVHCSNVGQYADECTPVSKKAATS